MKKLQRFLTALMTLLFIAPSYSAMAADMPADFYIVGHVQKGTESSNWSTCLQYTTKDEAKKRFVFDISITNSFNGGGSFAFRQDKVDGANCQYGENYYRPTGKVSGQDETAALNGIYTMERWNSDTSSPGWFLSAGNYRLVVDFSSDAPVLRVLAENAEIKDPEPAEFPGELYLIGNVADGNGWGNVGFNIQGTRNEENRTFTFIEARINGSFAFCNDVTTNADGCKSHDGFYGPSGSDAPANIGANNTMVNKSGHGYTIDSGYYDIVAYFPESGAPYFTITKVEGVEDWYFVGDLNNWFSTEFTEEGGGQSFIGDDSLWATTKHNWKFKRVTADINAELAEQGGWYMFDNFPLVDGHPTLSGQFKIKDSSDRWSGNEYVHPSDVTYANDENFKDYNAGTLREEYIGKGEPFPGTVLVKKAGNINHDGGNLHFQCNAVRNATIYFNPNFNGKPALRIDGDPVDYFIFYCRGEEGDEDNTVRGRVVEGKPNSNNYYLPGTTGGNGVTLENPAGGEHMNIGDGKTFHKIDLTKSATEILAQFAAAFPTAYPNSKVNQAMFKDIAEKKKLPNGVVIDDRDFIYIEKVPNGFASPAGVHFSMRLNQALDTESKKVPTILSTKHIYYLNAYTPVYVHVNYDGMKGAYKGAGYDDPKVSYRVYYTKSYTPVGSSANTYGRYVVRELDYWPSSADEDEYALKNEELDHLISWGSNLPLTKNDPVGNKIGWVELNEYKNQSEWGATSQSHNHPDIIMWNVNWGHRRDVETAQSIAAYAANDIEDQRLRLRSRYSTAYVQFRVEVPHKTDPSKTIVNYFPPQLDIKYDSEHYPIGGKDLYVVMDNKDGVWTGVDDIEIDYWYDGDEVEDNSVPVFYNLQGTKVANPSNGIFIMVKGGKSKKVFIK